MLFYMMVFLYGLWIIEALRRNGINPTGIISALNPFAAWHRARWRSKLNTNPLYALDDPRDALTVVLISLIKSTGEITTEQKQLVLTELRRQFGFSEEEASHYFAQNSFLMRDTVDIVRAAPEILACLSGNVPREQWDSIRQTLEAVSTERGRVTANSYQKALMEKTMELIAKTPAAR